MMKWIIYTFIFFSGIYASDSGYYIYKFFIDKNDNIVFHNSKYLTTRNANPHNIVIPKYILYLSNCCSFSDAQLMTIVTLDVINEIVSREMTSTQADISSYFDTNAALFDTRQIPGGDPAFFMQASLASYDKTIYATQASIAGTDPVVQHQIKMREHKKKTSDAYRNLMELLNARNVQ